MIHGHPTNLPFIFRIGAGAISDIPHCLEKTGVSFGNMAELCGGTFSKQFAVQISKAAGCDLYTIDTNSAREVDVLAKEMAGRNYDCMIGVGGGRVLDMVKRLGHLTGIGHIAVPTIISNDGLISPIAVIADERGRTHSLPALAPAGVVVDLDIIGKAPSRYLEAAAGDILSNLSATNDWLLAHRDVGEKIYDIAFQMSRMAAHSLVYFDSPRFDYEPFIRHVIQSQVNSGIAMSIAGTSRPCSGSEHLLSHALDFLELSTNLHGFQVGSLSMLCLYLQGLLDAAHIQYVRRIGLPMLLPSVAGMSDFELRQLFDCAKTMRVGRYTILDTLSPESFVLQVRKYAQEYAGAII